VVNECSENNAIEYLNQSPIAVSTDLECDASIKRDDVYNFNVRRAFLVTAS